MGDPSPLDYQNLAAAVHATPGWSLQRYRVQGQRGRWLIRDGSNYKEKPWEPL